MYTQTFFIFVNILLPSLRNEAIVKNWKLRIISQLNFVSKFIFTGILHEGMIGDELFDLKFSLVLFGNLNPACDFVCLQIDGNIIPERKFVAGVIVEEILKHIRNGLEIRMRFPFQNPISERSIF